MPRIVVTADSGEETVVLAERVAPVQIECDHYAEQLIQRVAWAVRDADQLEHDPRREPLVTTAP